MSNDVLIPIERIEESILLIRGQKVILDADLAKLYGVSTKRLNEQVKRNAKRFPDDFAFKLTKSEKEKVVANCDHLTRIKFSPALPFAFTEHGAIMAASVLNSNQAIDISVFIVRAFIRLRQILATQKDFDHKILELESRLSEHDQAIISLLDAINQLMKPPKKKQGQIGFKPNLE